MKKQKQLISRLLGVVLAGQCLAGGFAAAAAEVSADGDGNSAFTDAWFLLEEDAAVLTAENEAGTEQVRVEQFLSATSVQAGETVEVSAELYNELTKAYITDTDVLAQKIVICDIIGDNGTRSQDMTLGSDGKFRTQFSLPDRGSCFVMTRVLDQELNPITESFLVTVTASGEKPVPISDISLSVRSQPLHTSAAFLLSDYVNWDSTGMVSVSVKAPSSGYFRVSHEQLSNDVHFLITGVKAGTDTVDITVTDAYGDSCTVGLQVRVTNGWLPLILAVAAVCAAVVLVCFIRRTTRPKLNGAVMYIRISVHSAAGTKLLPDQQIILPKNSNSATLYQILHARNNAGVLRSLEFLIQEANLNETFRNIRIRARKNNWLSLIMHVKKGSQTVNGRTISGTTEFSLGSGTGTECVILCGNKGELVITY